MLGVPDATNSDSYSERKAQKLEQNSELAQVMVLVGRVNGQRIRAPLTPAVAVIGRR